MDEIDDLGRNAGREARNRGQRLANSVSLDTNSRKGTAANKRTAWIAAAAATLLIVAGIAAIAGIRSNQTVQTTSTDAPTLPSPTSSAASTEVATTQTTQSTQTTPVTATSEPTPTTSSPSTSPSSSNAPSTVEPPAQQAPEQVAIWPAADVVFDRPQAAADDFLSNVFGVGVLGNFQQIDARSGEIEVRSNADAPPGTTFPRALLQLRQLRPTDGWYVTSATSEGASISLPSAGAQVPAGPLTVDGEARGSESTLNVFAFTAGPDFSALDDIDAVRTSGGAFEQTEPYSATIDLSEASPGDVITILVRGDVGLSDDPGEFAAIPIVIATPIGDAATWTVASEDPPSPDASTFTALVSRLGCNGSVTGKVFKPTVEAADGEIVVTFTVEPVDGPQRCPGNIGVPVTVELSEPIGTRKLVDGGCRSGEATSTSLCVDGATRWTP